MKDVIAETSLICERPSGERLSVVAKVGRPYLGQDGLWVCPVSLSDLYSNLADIKSDDSFQSLCLAIHLIRSLLTSFTRKGGRVLIPGTENEDEDFPLEAYFPPFSENDGESLP